MRRRCCRLIFCLALMLLAAAHTAGRAGAASGPRRFALLIGSDLGDPTEARLRYAEDDARRVGTILQRVGDFAPEDVVLLARPSVVDVVHALETLERRLAGTPDSLLFVFYSGHADAESIHLGAGRFPLSDLRAFVSRAPATARVLVVDACRSGAVTRVKGGRPGPAFDVKLEPPVGAKGFAILTSSAAGEEAQESDELRSSFFTHYFSSALLGAADRDRDGSVTLEEAFGYASDRTLVATSATVPGPQHPTYRYDLSGRETLVLTRPGLGRSGIGAVEFPRAGWFLLRKSGGPVLAEVHSDEPGRRIALEAGTYRVTMRLRDCYLEGDVTVRANEVTVVPLDRLPRQPYTAVAKKGGEPVELVRAPRTQPWKRMYSAGLGLFAAGHMLAAMLSISSFWTGLPSVDGPMAMAPVVGPIGISVYRLSFATNATFGEQMTMSAFYLFTAAVQAIGLGLTIRGDVLRRRSYVDRGLVVAPVAAPGAYGLGVGATF